ncbi:hypothetical protein [Ensifer adhaerens]|uniref:hypothetical protein n=1 Tax=Ensifer adhaerens TaxID=106592 RepID=UPI000DC4C058|nr:hypothetical protein [Ensifer adhaerens]RAS13531.1 hypothetical protein DEU52_106129 [Ensifer adhaerens]
MKIGVKKLNWFGDYAHTCLGIFYHLNELGADRSVILEKIEGDSTFKSFHSTREIAKSSAQEDFDLRIMSVVELVDDA